MALGALGVLVTIALAGIAGDGVGYLLLALNGLAALFLFVFAYVFQDRPPREAGTYQRMVAQLAVAQETLRSFGDFLDGERAQARELKETVPRLQREKAELDVALGSARAAVDRVLEAHAARQRRFVWKERAFGFAIGVASSLAASVLWQAWTSTGP